jgi:hypothetical protein
MRRGKANKFSGRYDLGSSLQFLTSGSSLQFLSFATNKTRPVTYFKGFLDSGAGFAGSGVAISLDGRWILYTPFDQAGSELMLVENFR